MTLKEQIELLMSMDTATIKKNRDKKEYFRPEFFQMFQLQLDDYWINDIRGFDIRKFILWVANVYGYQAAINDHVSPQEVVIDKWGQEAADIINVLLDTEIEGV